MYGRQRPREGPFYTLDERVTVPVPLQRLRIGEWDSILDIKRRRMH
jgi:hypothetical protein